MRRTCAALALLFAGLAPWADATACSCLRPALTDLYKDSAHVILGEVVSVELQTRDAVHGQEVTYVATVKPVETYKGPSDVVVRVTYTGLYAEPGRPLPPPTVVDEVTGETLVLVGGCGGGMAVGVKYFIFEKQGEPLHYGGWCTQRVMYESIIVPDYMRSLRDAR
jgi:hypothetical protein